MRCWSYDLLFFIHPFHKNLDLGSHCLVVSSFYLLKQEFSEWFDVCCGENSILKNSIPNSSRRKKLASEVLAQYPAGCPMLSLINPFLFNHLIYELPLCFSVVLNMVRFNAWQQITASTGKRIKTCTNFYRSCIFLKLTQLSY